MVAVRYDFLMATRFAVPEDLFSISSPAVLRSPGSGGVEDVQSMILSEVDMVPVLYLATTASAGDDLDLVYVAAISDSNDKLPGVLYRDAGWRAIYAEAHSHSRQPSQ